MTCSISVDFPAGLCISSCGFWHMGSVIIKRVERENKMLIQTLYITLKDWHLCHCVSLCIVIHSKNVLIEFEGSFFEEYHVLLGSDAGCQMLSQNLENLDGGHVPVFFQQPVR